MRTGLLASKRNSLLRWADSAAATTTSTSLAHPSAMASTHHHRGLCPLLLPFFEEEKEGRMPVCLRSRTQHKKEEGAGEEMAAIGSATRRSQCHRWRRHA